MYRKMCYIRIYISRILKIYFQDNLKNMRNAKISYIQKILNLPNMIYNKF